MAQAMRYYDNEDRLLTDDDMSRIGGGSWTRAEFDCAACGAVVARWRGGGYDVSCDDCGAQYNASGQRLRDDWRSNRSNWDENVSDMDGFEESQLAAER